MDFRDYIRILRVRWRLIAVSVLAGLAVATGLALHSTPLYKATAQVFVSTSTDTSASNSGLQQGNQFAQQRVKSYADIINSPLVTTPVIKELGLATTPRALARKISARAPLDTVLINIAVMDSSPAAAQRVANAVAAQFTKVAAALETPTGSTTSPVKVSVVRQADLPRLPVTPRPKLNLALGLLAGLALGGGASVLRETLDTRLRDIDEIQNTLHLPTLGVISFDGEAPKRPLIVQADPHSSRAEAFRQLRTNLQFVDVDHPPRSIVVTSSVPQEGKSTTTCNLAIALSQAKIRVILVEADLRRPRLAEYLGVESAAGLTDVLVGRASLADVLQPWGKDGMSILPSGPTPPNPSELLGSQQMRELLAELEQQCDLVLLDAPPLLPVTDAAVLSGFTSGTVLVVRSGGTTREQATRAVEILKAVDAHVYGVVLNMVPTRGPGAYRYGYQGYGYGYASEATPLSAEEGPSDTEPQPRGAGSVDASRAAASEVPFPRQPPSHRTRRAANMMPPGAMKATSHRGGPAYSWRQAHQPLRTDPCRRLWLHTLRMQKAEPQPPQRATLSNVRGSQPICRS